MKKEMLFVMLVLALALMPMAYAGPLEQLDDIITSVNPNPDLSEDMIRDSPALWTFATFTIVFAIVFAAASILPFLQGNKRIAAVISAVLAFIAIFAPGAMRLIAILGYWGMIALVISALALLLWQGIKGMMPGKGERAPYYSPYRHLPQARQPLPQYRQPFRARERYQPRARTYPARAPSIFGGRTPETARPLPGERHGGGETGPETGEGPRGRDTRLALPLLGSSGALVPVSKEIDMDDIVFLEHLVKEAERLLGHLSAKADMIEEIDKILQSMLIRDGLVLQRMNKLRQYVDETEKKVKGLKGKAIFDRSKILEEEREILRYLDEMISKYNAEGAYLNQLYKLSDSAGNVQDYDNREIITLQGMMNKKRKLIPRVPTLMQLLYITTTKSVKIKKVSRERMIKIFEERGQVIKILNELKQWCIDIERDRFRKLKNKPGEIESKIRHEEKIISQEMEITKSIVQDLDAQVNKIDRYYKIVRSYYLQLRRHRNL